VHCRVWSRGRSFFLTTLTLSVPELGEILHTTAVLPDVCPNHYTCFSAHMVNGLFRGTCVALPTLPTLPYFVLIILAPVFSHWEHLRNILGFSSFRSISRKNDWAVHHCAPRRVSLPPRCHRSLFPSDFPHEIPARWKKNESLCATGRGGDKCSQRHLWWRVRIRPPQVP